MSFANNQTNETSNTKRPFAVFDIDGTLIRWQLYHAIADEMGNQGILSKEDYENTKKARMTWLERSSEDSFLDYEAVLIRIVENAIPGIHENVVEEICSEVINKYKNQVHTFTRDKIISLKKQNYLIFAISGSPEIIVKLLSTYYNFDDYGGSKYEIINHHYTGKNSILNFSKKTEYLNKLIVKHNATLKGSQAYGDSEGDIPLLTHVEQPTAFNPTKKLYLYAQQQRWPIVIERKNVIYYLEPQDNETYLLATTNN